MELGETRRLWIVEPVEEVVATPDEEESAPGPQREPEHEPEPSRERVPAGA